MNKKQVFECVLPDGRFARIRQVKWGDLLVAFGTPQFLLPAIAMRTCTLDDKELTLQEWLEQDIEDIAPVIAELNKRVNVITQNTKGVA